MNPVVSIGRLQARALLCTTMLAVGVAWSGYASAGLDAPELYELREGHWVAAPPDAARWFETTGAVRPKVTAPAEYPEIVDVVALPDRRLVGVGGGTILVRAHDGKWTPTRVGALGLKTIAMLPSGDAWALGARGLVVALPGGRVIVGPGSVRLDELRVSPDGPRFFGKAADVDSTVLWRGMVIALGVVFSGIGLGLTVPAVRRWRRASRFEAAWERPEGVMDDELGWRVELKPRHSSPPGTMTVRLLAEEVTVSTREVRYALLDTVEVPAAAEGGRILLEGTFDARQPLSGLDLVLEITPHVGGASQSYRKAFRA